MSTVPERSEIDEEYKWDLASLYADTDEWETAFEEANELTEVVASYEGQATEDAETLLSVLEDYEALMRTVSNVVSYARMRQDEDTRDDDAKALFARARSLSADASSAASFLDPEIQDLDRDEVEAMIEAEPALEEYEHYFDDVLRMKPHTRSTEVESLLADLSEVTGAAGDVYDMLTNADMSFPTVEDSQGEAVEITLNNFTTLQKRQDRQFRREVYEGFYDEWEDVRNAVGSATRTRSRLTRRSPRRAITRRHARLPSTGRTFRPTSTTRWSRPSVGTSIRSTVTPNSSASTPTARSWRCGISTSR